MTNFVAFNSRWRVAVLVLVSAGFMVAGLWMVGAFGEVPTSRKLSPPVTVTLGCFTLLFFGTCVWFGVKKFLDDGVQLEIGPGGIRFTSWCDHLIPWSEIIDVTTWSHRQQKYVVLHLREPSRFPGKGLAGKLARANKMMTGGDVAISLTGTDRTYLEAMDAIAQFRGNMAQDG